MDDFRSTIGKHRMACFFLFPSSIVNQLPRPVPAPIVQLLAGKLASSLSIVNRSRKRGINRQFRAPVPTPTFQLLAGKLASSLSIINRSRKRGINRQSAPPSQRQPFSSLPESSLLLFQSSIDPASAGSIVNPRPRPNANLSAPCRKARFFSFNRQSIPQARDQSSIRA